MEKKTDLFNELVDDLQIKTKEYLQVRLEKKLGTWIMLIYEVVSGFILCNFSGGPYFSPVFKSKKLR